MKWEELLEIVGDEPVFSSAILMAGDVSVQDVRRQLSRWVRSGKVIQLRRGLYALSDPYRKFVPHPFVLANALKPASYVSLQSALAFYGLIPEYTPVVTSVCTGRPERLETEFGTFFFSHVKDTWFTGYRKVEVSPGQSAFLAIPEKSLLDLIYLTPGADAPDYLGELRLQGLESVDQGVLTEIARKSGSPKLIRAAGNIEDLRDNEGAPAG